MNILELMMLIVLGGIFLLLLDIARRMAAQKSATVLANAQLFDPGKDVTTVLPVPLHAATCDHLWDVQTEQLLEMPHEKRVVVVMVCRHCGVIDKTVQVTSPQPPPQPPPPKEPPPPCSHEWDAVVQQNMEMPHEKKIVAVLTCRKCGAVDKTVEATSKAPPPPQPVWMKSECRHKWETEKKVVLDSAYEQMLKSISERVPNSRAKVNSDRKIDLDLNEAPAWMFRKTYVCVRVCNTCGEIDKIITSNFDVADAIEEDPGAMDTIQVKKKKA